MTGLVGRLCETPCRLAETAYKAPPRCVADTHSVEPFIMMPRLPHLFSAIAGLLLGLLGSHAAFLHRTANNPATPPGADDSMPSQRDGLQRSARPGDAASDRIARIFSALKEPGELARRYALREAMRDLPPRNSRADRARRASAYRAETGIHCRADDRVV